MRRENLAERILQQVMANDRAAAIVGDLSEEKRRRSAIAFWMSIMGIVLASTWTWLIALAAGIYLAAWSVVFFNGLLFGQSMSHVFFVLDVMQTGSSATDPVPQWLTSAPIFFLLDSLAKVGTLILIVSPYTVIRYGLKDKVTRLTVVWLVLIIGMISFALKPVVFVVCIAAAVASIVACLWTSGGRRAFAVVAITVVAGASSWPIVDWLVSLVHHPAFGCELQGCVMNANPLLGQSPALTASQLCLAVPVILVCTLVHDRLIDIGKGGMESASGEVQVS